LKVRRLAAALHPLEEKMQIDFYDQVQTLRNTGDPFAIATVVRAEKPTVQPRVRRHQRLE